MVRTSDSRRCLSGGQLSDAAQLREVIQVVAGHGFDHGLEGHCAPLGMSHGSARGGGQRGLNQPQVPLAQRAEGFKRLGRGNTGIMHRPLVLIEGLDDRVIFSERLAQAEGEDDLAIGQVTEDFGGAPFAGRRRLLLFGTEDFEVFGDGVGRCSQDDVERPSVEKLLVWVDLAHGNASAELLCFGSVLVARGESTARPSSFLCRPGKYAQDDRAFLMRTLMAGPQPVRASLPCSLFPVPVLCPLFSAPVPCSLGPSFKYAAPCAAM